MDTYKFMIFNAKFRKNVSDSNQKIIRRGDL
jgi:hypothetical protein